jgi:hypothetical protein
MSCGCGCKLPSGREGRSTCQVLVPPHYQDSLPSVTSPRSPLATRSLARELLPVNHSTLAPARAVVVVANESTPPKTPFGSDEIGRDHSTKVRTCPTAGPMFQSPYALTAGECERPSIISDQAGMEAYSGAILLAFGMSTNRRRAGGMEPCTYTSERLCGRNHALATWGQVEAGSSWTIAKLMETINAAVVEAHNVAASAECPTIDSHYRRCAKVSVGSFNWYAGFVLCEKPADEKIGKARVMYSAVAQVPWVCEVQMEWTHARTRSPEDPRPPTSPGGTPTSPDGGGLASFLMGDREYGARMGGVADASETMARGDRRAARP